MHKLLPFRQYDEKDVINLFQLDVTGQIANLKAGGTGWNKQNWSGTNVIVDTSNDWTADDPTLTTNSYLGAIGSGDQGFAMQEGSIYPEAPIKVDPAGSGAVNSLGLTLKPTLAYDENDEKLLYYAVTKDELQCVLPGEAVPVATRGFFTISADAITAGAVGNGLIAAANGTLTASAAVHASNNTGVGVVLASGDRSGDGTVDTYFIQYKGHQG